MNKKPVIFVVATLVLSWSLFSSFAIGGEVIKRIVERKTLVLGTTGHFPPFVVKAKDGSLMGFDIDIAKVIANQLGVKLKIQQMQIESLFPALEKGEIDLALAGITITSKRNMRVVFLGPYFVSGQSILGKREIVTKIKSPEAMNRPDFTLVVTKNTTSEQAAKALVPKANIVRVSNMDEALRMVLQGKAQALFADEPFCVVAAFRNKDTDLAVSEPFTFEPLGVAIPENDYLWINFVDNLLMKLNATGELKKLKEYWFNNPEWMERLPKKKEFM